MIFWDTKKNTRTVKYVKNLMDVTSHGAFSLITARVSEANFILILSNSLGSPVDNRIINIKPTMITMNKSHVFVTNKHYIYVWQFRGYTPTNDPKTHHYSQDMSIDLYKKKMMKEAIFFIEDNPNMSEMYNYETFNPTKISGDPISALFSNDKFLVVACDSGRVFRYNLPHISQPDQIIVGVKLGQIGVSPNGQYIWGIDETNIFSIWDIEKSTTSGKRLKPTKLDFEKKDVWSVLWSSDDPFKFALLEKNRLNIIKELEVEEILTCNGYLADCSQLGVTAVMLEDLMEKSWETNHQVSDIVIQIETRILRDLREMMNNNIDVNDIYQFIERNSNRKLWELFAEYSLLKLDFISAEKAMLQYNDYLGLSFIKRVKNIDDDLLKKAEIYQFFLDYDKAEEVYNLADRKDLIISMRIKLGHWEKVIQLIKESGYVQEDNMKMAYNNLAMKLFDDKEYEQAEELFKKTNNSEALINLYFKTENYDKAAQFIDTIPEGSQILLEMGEKFETVRNNSI